MTPSVASRADINAQQSKDPGEKRRVMRTQDHGGSAQKSSTTWGKRIRDKIPPWITRNLANTKSWKLLVRCWVASWATVVLLLPNRSLHALGNAAFFAGVASIILPPNMPIQSFVFAVTMLIMGCLIGWAWGSAAMAAALRTRNAAATRAALAQVSSSGANSENSARFLQESVFRGAFLDTKSSIVFGVFLGVGAFILGLTRAKNPKLTIPTIFATIFLDVFCSYGPLFPTAQYNLLDTFVISTACYIAIALAVIILIFPETLNHQWMSSYIDLVSAVHELIQIQEKVLQVRIEELDSDVEKNTLLNQIQNKGADLLKSFQALSEKSKMLEMEFTYGQLSGADLKLFELPMRNLVTRTRGLQSFPTLLTDHIEWGRQDWVDDEAPDAQPIDARSRPLSPNKQNETAVEMEESTESNGLHIGDTYLLLHGRQRYQYLESVHHLRIQELLPILRSATSDLRSACLGGCDAAKSTFLIINTNRYKRKAQRLVHVEDGKEARLSEESEDVSTALTKLKTALKDYTENRRHEILEPFKPFLVSFDDIQVDREGRLPFSLRPLFLCFVFQSNLIWTAESLISLLTLVQAAQRKRPSRRLWAPKGIRSIVHLWRGGPNHSPLGEDLPPIDDAPSSDDEDVEPEKRYCRDPDSCPPQHIGHKLGQALYKGYMWTSRPETILSKVALVGTNVEPPIVINAHTPDSDFTYAERGLWGLIMAQMTLQIWISDQIYL
ncbi:hypothetical protein FRC02_002104 [Tulasnella sp. 418]|nr:hypothetical protein FRC02_002104 [Tulasnella sp. 418]